MLQNSRQLTFRPSPAPAFLSPVTVRSTGHYKVQDWTENRSPRNFTQVYWVQTGQLWYVRKGMRYEASRGMTFFFPTGEAHRIETSGEPCDYWWVTFDGSLVGTWLDGQFPDPAPRSRGACPVELMRRIRASLIPASPIAEREAATLGLRLLMEFTGSPIQRMASPPPEEALCTRIERILEDHFTDPDFGIEVAAAMMGRHRTTLFRTYRDRRGITPSDYLQRLRLRHGLELLKAGELSVTEVALASGFRDANYFAKVVRQATGESPRQIRGRFPRN